MRRIAYVGAGLAMLMIGALCLTSIHVTEVVAGTTLGVVLLDVSTRQRSAPDVTGHAR